MYYDKNMIGEKVYLYISNNVYEEAYVTDITLGYNGETFYKVKTTFHGHVHTSLKRASDIITSEPNNHYNIILPYKEEG